MAGDILAERDGEAGDAIVIYLGTENLGQAHNLTFRVRQFQAHEHLAGNHFNHADRGQRQRTRQVARQADNLAALDAGRRFDFVAGNHRPRISGHYLDLHPEIGKFFLDQAAGEFQRFDAHGLLLRRRFIQQ